MRDFGKLGKDEGKHTGPPAGDGADVAHTPDTDGTPGDVLPERKVKRADAPTRPTHIGSRPAATDESDTGDR